MDPKPEVATAATTALYPRAGAASLDKALALLVDVVRGHGDRPVRAIAAAHGIPSSTARRMIAAMARHGLVMPVGGGCAAIGATLAGLAVPSHADLLAQAARPSLRALAREFGLTAHLGVLADGMVTYLAKESGRVRPLFTREDNQLEAYCSAVGKVLLAALPDAAREAYLAADTFVALTPRTITRPDSLRDELAAVRARGHATDDEEIAAGLHCLGVPLHDAGGTVVAAVSISGARARFHRHSRDAILARLHQRAAEIAARLGLWRAPPG